MKTKIMQGCLFMLTLVLSLPAVSQESKVYQIKGTVVDSVSRKAMEYVTVVLKSQDNKPLERALTTGRGGFVIKVVAAGKYQISIVSVGHKPKVIAVDASGNELVIDKGSITLSNADNQLKEVTVTGDRPMVKQEVDRISYDVQADPESKVNNVLDMLRKVPLVSIDADDNIQIKGSSSFKVLINGRPSSLVARSPKDVFKSMPASDIQKIEVITTPPAKYDSEGLAGIINIITSKKVDQGYNGSVSARYRFPQGPGTNAQLTVKGSKFGLSTYMGGSLRNTPNTLFSMSRIAHPSGTTLFMDGDRENENSYGYSNAELSYEFDSLNLVTAEFGYNKGSGNNNSFQRVRQSSFSPGENMSYRIDNLSDYDWNGYELGLNYQLGFKRNKEQLLTGSYKFNGSADDNSSNFFAQDRVNYPVEQHGNYGQNNKSGTKEQTIQLDYLHPIKKLNIEGGLKIILRDNFSDFEYGDYDASGNYIIDNTRSNEFDYRQNVYSFYNSYQLKVKDWGFKAGLRLERTVIDANFISTSSFFKTDYNNFIPSISVQRKLKNNNSINLGYTQRIQRPNIWQLNPYVEQFNENFTRSGNTELDPVLNHNFDLNYSIFKKGSINTGISYSFANNTIQYVNRLEGNVSRATFENIGKDKNLGFNFSTNQEITKMINFNVNGRLSYIWMEGVIDNNLLKNDGVQGNIYAYVGYKLKNDWRAGINAGFYSAWITLQGQSNPYYYTSASLSKEFLKKKLSVSGSVNNPFQKFRNWKNDTNGSSFSQTESFQNYYRNFSLNLTYKFGQLNGEIKKNRRGINNDDVAGKSSSN